MLRPPKPISLRTADIQREDGDAVLTLALQRFSEETNQAFRSLPPFGVLSLNFTAPSSPTPNVAPFPMVLRLPFGGRCGHIGPGSGRIVSPLGAYIETSIIPDWSNSGAGLVSIRNLSGLIADATYELTFLAVGEL